MECYPTAAFPHILSPSGPQFVERRCGHHRASSDIAQETMIRRYRKRLPAKSTALGTRHSRLFSTGVVPFAHSADRIGRIIPLFGFESDDARSRVSALEVAERSDEQTAAGTFRRYRGTDPAQSVASLERSTGLASGAGRPHAPVKTNSAVCFR